MITLDRTDRAILAALQADGRISNVRLAEQVALSESACLRRVRALEESGLIAGYTTLVDPALAGYPTSVFVQVTLAHQQQQELTAFETAVAAIPEVMECWLMSGDADYLLRVIVRDAADYERLHSHHLTRLPGVDRVKSSFALRAVTRRAEVPLGG